ncbi:DHA2 family efflux MFS transporter permease subunit [Streptomyces sp. AC536]|uniref:DHA2 family efflux MFS transporter permease subunit n=1 Tax=Streptomyces buecherae TaxID=2763006 RepID=UPI00164D7FD1|nr:DHA2 family efflux MFS transporter permease subunit [Streptomyces buecherae]MBC3987029.1 DHA2 family efflux MFS transporter permease subunit [Streptomyces buecherae]QNJ40711.1 DHA2 family efflux MFS transporter permease subunit [Streptomyces buecherae]
MLTDRPPTKATAVWTLVITSIAGFMAALDNLIVITAIPDIGEDLGGGIEELEWTVNAYTLSFAVLLMLGAALGDRFGRRRVFGVGIALFTASSAGAALSSDIGLLIAARAAQGVGAALLMPLSLTLLTAAVPAERRGMAYGIWGAVNGLAVASGPLIGGAVVEHISWQWIFWLNVPIGIALLPLARLRLVESRGPADRLDVVGTVLASLGLLGITFALIQGNIDGWTSAPVLAGFGLGAALLVAFVRWELHTDAPMLPMRLFRSRAFSTVNAAGLLMYLGMFGSIFLLTQFLQLVQGYSPLEAGVRMLPWTAMPMIIAPLAGALSDRIDGRLIVATGLALMAVGIGWQAAIAEPGLSYAAQVAPFAISGVGMALFFAPVSALVMNSVRPAEQGIASGASNALREIGGTLGVALLASVFSARGGYGAPREFTDGLTPALWVGGGALALAAVLVLLAPRQRPAGSVAEGPAPALAEPGPARHSAPV